MNGLRVMAAALALGVVAAAQAAQIDMFIWEKTPGEWDVYFQVSGADTAGLAAYSLWVEGTDLPVTFTQNTLSTLNESYEPIGFIESYLQQGTFPGYGFNAGNYQVVASAILGVGKTPVFVSSPTPEVDDVVLGVPALLGTLHTAPGLGIHNFRAGDALLLTADASAYLQVSGHTIPVHVFPEPASMGLLALGGFALPRRRR